MTLTFGRSPFGPERGAFDCDVPAQVAYVEPWPRRMRALLMDRTVLDTRRGSLLHRSGHPPMLLLRPEDLDVDELIPEGPAGDRWAVRVGLHTVAAAVVAAPVLGGEAGARVQDLVSLRWDAVDRWFEEDDPVYAHLRDPFHRVDVRSSSMHVLVRHQGRVVAESRRPKLLFETGLPVRHYLPFADVRTDLLQPSRTVSQCPYKGDGQHWHLTDGAGRTVVEDVGWSLPHPFPEALAAHEHLCFYPDQGDVTIDVDPDPDPDPDLPNPTTRQEPLT